MGKSILIAFLLIAASSCFIFGQGIQLGDRFVPKDSFFVFIFCGNSAMSGRDDSPDKTPDPHAWKYEMSPANYDWTLAIEPLCEDVINTGDRGGPGMPFLKRLARDYPNRYFGIMQLSGSGWICRDNFLKGTTAYNDMIDKAKAIKNNVTIAAIVSMFNLVEIQHYADDNSLVDSYLNDIENMVSDMRTDLGMPELPYLHSGYPVNAKGENAITLPETQAIMAEIGKIPDNISNSLVIPTDGLTISDYSHYDRAGNMAWGARVADSIKSHNWVPATTNREKPVLKGSVSGSHPAICKVLFDGSNWMGLGKSVYSFSVYSLNGRIIPGIKAGRLRDTRLPPGIYLLRSEGLK